MLVLTNIVFVGEPEIRHFCYISWDVNMCLWIHQTFTITLLCTKFAQGAKITRQTEPLPSQTVSPDEKTDITIGNLNVQYR